MGWGFRFGGEGRERERLLRPLSSVTRLNELWRGGKRGEADAIRLTGE